MTTAAPDRRRPWMGWYRALARPVPSEAIERHAVLLARRLAPWLQAAFALAALVLLVRTVAPWWAARDVTLVPRYRAEALCFALAQPPPFAPPMRVESSAAMVRGRFASITPAPVALRTVMRLEDDQVLRERHTRVGDFEVTALWLRLPERGVWRHWLVVGWMEGADLAVCNFRFAGTGPRFAYDELLWSDALLTRALTPEHFDAAALPAVRLRGSRGTPLPTFGP